MAESTSDTSNLSSYVPKLNRVKGQIVGIVNMCNEERPAVEIAQQLVAARNALARVTRELVTHEAQRCANQQCYDDLEAIVKEVLR